MEFKADLHTHTTHSDGWLSVESLLRRAILHKIDVLAITDHDTVSGYHEAIERNQKYGIRIIPGIELSAQYLEYEVHVLGYFFDTRNPRIIEYTQTLRADRYSRCERIVENLRGTGVDITMADVEAECKGDMFGRPHIARALIRKKIAKTFSHAFREFLGNNSASYEKKYFITPSDAVELIHQAGGIAVLAHPGYLDDESLKTIIAEKFDAIEAIHPSHSLPQRQKFMELAKQLGIPWTGGSDFHGGSATDRGYIGQYFLSKQELAAVEALVRM